MKNTPPSHRWSFSKASCLLLSVLASGVALSSSAQAASGTWSSTTSGNWTNTGNWLSGVEASGVGSIANFNGVDLTANVAVHLDAPRTVGGLTFSDTDTGTLFSYTLDNNGSASNVLTLDTGTATAAAISVASGNTATISLVIAGTTGLTKTNASGQTGTLILSGNNTYSGVTTISGGNTGFIQANSNAAFGSSTLFMSATNGGIRYGSAFNDLRDIAFGANGGRLDTNGFNVTYSSTLSGAITGGNAFTKTGAGTLILAGTNNVTGAGGVIVSGGFLQIDSDARLGGGTGALTLNASNSGIRFGSAFNNLRAISLGNSGGTIDTNGFNVNYSSSISSVGGGTFTKAGLGTLRLTGANSYTGQTTINAGTLLVNSSISSAAVVSVISTATLGGTGSIAGATTIFSGGTLSPGDSVGTLAFGSNLSLSNGSTYAFQGGDLVTVAGALTLTDNWTLSLSGLVDGGSVTVFTFGTLAASPDLVPTFDISQLGFTPTGPLSLSVVGNTVVLNGLQAVPEPGTYALLFVAGGLIFGIRRWHARKVAA